ncbi:MAG: CPBP family intramembrane metalloprotease [Verrucomicrobia bacterium]|nr:CPBP family intramembrane metalloprotease [Verrucomicrobiota bacterium]
MLSEKPWKPDAVLMLLMGLLVCMSVGASVSLLVESLALVPPARQKFASFCINAAVLQGSVLVMTFFFLREHKIGWAEAFGLSSPGKIRAFALAALVCAIALPATWWINSLSVAALKSFQQAPVQQITVQTLQKATSAESQGIFLLIAALLAPIGEEIIFRGILYPAVKQLGRPRLAVWGTALVFAVVHWNQMTFISLTLLAVALTWLYEKTNNLLAPIAAHSLFNSANFLIIVNEPWLRRHFGG